ncbi:glycoside hydrolase family 15 [Candidatus Woesearchaeota archaeon]|nr:glycoside hydrolase family 15 [Candidatus Woesearchaeota archaeon]
MISKSIQLLRELRYPNGLFAAARNAKTGYSRAWIRDNVYATLGLEAHERIGEAVKTLHALLDILRKHEYKIDWMIAEPHPKEAWRYIHARYDPEGKEILEPWGNKQNDAVGALLWKMGDLEKRGIRVLRGEDDERIVQKLVDYLAAIEYWHDADSGMWEEAEEIHASSIGACVAGLKAVSAIAEVDPALIAKGEAALQDLLPCESASKECDLALLSLIYPYNAVDGEMALRILHNVEDNLVRDKGVIRYVGDNYYNDDGEAEWTLGLPWLAMIYKRLNMPHKYAFYMRKTVDAMNEHGELPELYLATGAHNENTPLAWAQSLYLAAVA